MRVLLGSFLLFYTLILGAYAACAEPAARDEASRPLNLSASDEAPGGAESEEPSRGLSDILHDLEECRSQRWCGATGGTSLLCRGANCDAGLR